MRFTVTIVFCFLITCGFSQRERTRVKKLSINNKLDHFAARKVGDTIYFCHNLTTRRGRAIKDRFGGFIYTMYSGIIGKGGEIFNVERIKSTAKGYYNMSSATFSKDGKHMYFTSNHADKGENKLEDFETYNLLIQRAEYKKGKGWTNFTTLPFCDINYNYAHPALSPDGNTLYFIAKIDSTKGKSDIYKVPVNNHKTYGEMVRLNDNINSPRTEIFPFVSADNKLYFSSERRGGKGGLDVYVYDLNKSSDPDYLPKSLGFPINSIGDDFSFFLNDDLTTGYLSSRRSRGEGADDLYYFTNFDKLKDN